MKIKILFFLLFLFAACSGGGEGDVGISGRNLAITAINSRSFNPDVVYGQIDYYQLKVTAPDLKIPFVARFGGGVDSAKMAAIPTGADRTLTIEAFNPNGMVIRRGKKEGVSIIPGEYSHVEIVMHSVPIFTNVADKSAVCSTSMEFKVFGEPGSRLEILEKVGRDAEEPVKDRATSRALVNTAPEDGLFEHLPEKLELGVHAFVVRDMDSEESSAVTLTLYQATVRPGIALVSGGIVTRQGNEMVMSGVGQSYYRAVKQGSEDLGNTMLNVIDMIY